MTKHITKPAAEADVAERSTSVWGRPFGQIDFDEWFDRWPELFARRWPESFRGFPGADTAFKLEEFTEDDGTFVLRAELARASTRTRIWRSPSRTVCSRSTPSARSAPRSATTGTTAASSVTDRSPGVSVFPTAPTRRGSRQRSKPGSSRCGYRTTVNLRRSRPSRSRPMADHPINACRDAPPEGATRQREPRARPGGPRRRSRGGVRVPVRTPSRAHR